MNKNVCLLRTNYVSGICRSPIPYQGFPGGSAGKESAYSAGDLGLIPGLGRSPGEGKGYPLQYFGLENSMDCIVHGVAESDMTELLFFFVFSFLTTSLKGNTIIARKGKAQRIQGIFPKMTQLQ